MNCFDSNLIEGHNTHPRDIERALAESELEEETRPIALEAWAHVIGQRVINEMHRTGALPRPTSVELPTWVHRGFYDEMPDEFRVTEHPDGTHELIVLGRMRQDDDREVAFGRHLPLSSSRVAASMDHFDKLRRGFRADGSSRSHPPVTGRTTSTLSTMAMVVIAD